MCRCDEWWLCCEIFLSKIVIKIFHHCCCLLPVDSICVRAELRRMRFDCHIGAMLLCLCKSIPFTLRYVAFWHAKGMLSDADLPPFADREMAGAAWGRHSRGFRQRDNVFYLYKLCRLRVVAFANIFVILWCLVCRSASVVQRGSKPSGLVL